MQGSAYNAYEIARNGLLQALQYCTEHGTSPDVAALRKSARFAVLPKHQQDELLAEFGLTDGGAPSAEMFAASQRQDTAPRAAAQPPERKLTRAQEDELLEQHRRRNWEATPFEEFVNRLDSFAALYVAHHSHAWNHGAGEDEVFGSNVVRSIHAQMWLKFHAVTGHDDLFPEIIESIGAASVVALHNYLIEWWTDPAAAARAEAGARKAVETLKATGTLAAA